MNLSVNNYYSTVSLRRCVACGQADSLLNCQSVCVWAGRAREELWVRILEPRNPLSSSLVPPVVVPVLVRNLKAGMLIQLQGA